MCEQKLNPDEILTCEFEYAAQAAFQAHEDRIRVFNYYLATAGTLIAAVVLGDLNNSAHLTVFALLFSTLAILGILSLLKLAKLRLAWVDSVRTMCRIKDYYIETRDEAKLEKAFRWTADTIPSPGKKWSVAFLMALTVGFMSSASVTGVVLFWGLAATGGLLVIWGVLAGLLSLVAQLVVCLCLCRD